MKIDLRCPKCGSDHTTRVPVEILDGVKGPWYLLIICSLFGGAISPLCLVFCIACLVIMIILNIIRKVSYKNTWLMQCQQCGNEFEVVNPDRVEAIQRKQKIVDEKREKLAEEYRIASKIKEECLAKNGVIQESEVLLSEIPNFGLHRNAFSTSYGNLKITDKGYIWYNQNGSVRIPRNSVVEVKKHNYFLVIPTGVQIKTRSKRKKYNFVVLPKEREGIIDKCNR